MSTTASGAATASMAFKRGSKGSRGQRRSPRLKRRRTVRRGRPVHSSPNGATETSSPLRAAFLCNKGRFSARSVNTTRAAPRTALASPRGPRRRRARRRSCLGLSQPYATARARWTPARRATPCTRARRPRLDIGVLGPGRALVEREHGLVDQYACACGPPTSARQGRGNSSGSARPVRLIAVARDPPSAASKARITTLLPRNRTDATTRTEPRGAGGSRDCRHAARMAASRVVGRAAATTATSTNGWSSRAVVKASVVVSGGCASSIKLLSAAAMGAGEAAVGPDGSVVRGMLRAMTAPPDDASSTRCSALIARESRESRHSRIEALLLLALVVHRGSRATRAVF